MRLIILLALLLLASCTTAAPREFEVASIPYDAANCTSTSYSNDGSSRAGMRIIIIDENGTAIDRATFQARFGTTGCGGAQSKEYQCIEQANNLTVELNVRAPGHLPTALAIPLEPEQLSTITIRLKPGCATPGNSTEEQRMYELIEQQFGWKREEYRVSCLEFEPSRGGYVQARGTHNGTPFSLRYRWGWCSSGGTDCGFDACLAMNATDTFTQTRDRFCGRLHSANIASPICEVDASDNSVFDNSTAVQESCRQGAFDIKTESRVIFSVSQLTNKCQSRATIGSLC